MKHCPIRDCPYREKFDSIAEYRDEVELCKDCGTRLKDGAPPELAGPQEEEDRSSLAGQPGDDLVTVATYPNAHAARAKLESQRIPLWSIRSTRHS